MIAAMDNARQAADDRVRGRVHVRVAATYAGVLLNSASNPLTSVLPWPGFGRILRFRRFNSMTKPDAVPGSIGRPPDDGGRSVRVASRRDERRVGDRRDVARSAAAGAQARRGAGQGG